MHFMYIKLTKDVHVNQYERHRFGRNEHVREHYRSHPTFS